MFDDYIQEALDSLPPELREQMSNVDIVVLNVGQEADAEKMLNTLAKDGFEVAFTTAPAKGIGLGDTPVIHLVLKRMVR